MDVKEVMTKAVVSVNRDSTIDEIAQVLIDNKVSGLPVLSDGGYLIGIVTEGDLLRREMSPRLPEFINILGAVIYYHGVERYNEDFKKILAQTASDIMTEDLITVKEDTDISEVARLMLNNNIKQIPVVDGSKLIGIVSRADIVKLLLKQE
ncbi:Inosine-5'-monophosphate dehydrogenase [bioreactor metagenome]|jgi:Predicted signal-transduction protein containing cAMP-binding and CBS domains|uniref:Inosine-5'-monophosphate dehydrogenase n=1 Tax=bioreactor metagenome TaxID=1076179 RepID=A0A644V5X0_9ZZZZ|nr:CBS domain-containing protein [Acidaminococcaceae bacterium]NLU43604.1 CBS domain-containing protein [Acholeplasmataceae bacterium]